MKERLPAHWLGIESVQGDFSQPPGDETAKTARAGCVLVCLARADVGTTSSCHPGLLRYSHWPEVMRFLDPSLQLWGLGSGLPFSCRSPGTPCAPLQAPPCSHWSLRVLSVERLGWANHARRQAGFPSSVKSEVREKQELLRVSPWAAVCSMTTTND